MLTDSRQTDDDFILASPAPLELQIAVLSQRVRCTV
jgi:hypothetical protein